MTIEIKEPVLEALIRKRLESGGFRNVEEVLLRALQSQDADEDWLRLMRLCRTRLGPAAGESNLLLATSAIRFSRTRSIAIRE